ncbi:FAD-dependent oxidoreductase [Niveispirillum cyanobacteriorum]|uniref:FAD-binding dehydrogenase n=1 Tax=Niveispirillum cyanobacteriorum TaxID=1612173 RepID=A0A2K9NHY2_9PROT|nr:FAD-dependent oxidoreductase [Niveispirillum cyanobacteriorum]AUN32186.1 FAD-binding dehydrogenase [Niveispirillum cyanobacteriorum]GGE74968.1 fumarate reductase flavoprotein subunit [Niveispirillum cyanobacteriorum]
MQFDYSIPVIVAGAGAAGAVAALAARGAGADVLLIEQDAVPFGTTSMSQGLLCAAGTAAQKRLGIHDDGDILYADIMAKTQGKTDPVLARAIADGAGPTLDWLVEQHGLPYELDVRFKAAFGHSRLRVHGWPGRSGNDMLMYLHRRLEETRVDVIHQARLVEIAGDGAGGVAGIVIGRPDGSHEAIGCDSLILATGGFAGNRDMVRTHIPDAGDAHYHGHEGSDGLGIRLGAGLGAELADMGAYQGYGMLTDPQGVTLPPGFILEGGFLVNQHGDRFVDETDDISAVVHPVLAQPDGRAWIIFDQRIEQACAHIPESAQLRELNAARAADSVIDLALRIGADPARLAASLDDIHRATTAGRPDSQGRRWTDPVLEAPFRALRLRGAIYHTQGGLRTDGSGRVLAVSGLPLRNLFACGGAARSVSGPSCWGYLPAMGICAAVTLGRLAGAEAARLVIAKQPT